MGVLIRLWEIIVENPYIFFLLFALMLFARMWIAQYIMDGHIRDNKYPKENIIRERIGIYYIWLGLFTSLSLSVLCADTIILFKIITCIIISISIWSCIDFIRLLKKELKKMQQKKAQESQ